MNKHYLIKICNKFDLGQPQDEPKRVHGGLLHAMWRINANHKSYAVKQLSKDIKLTEEVKKNYELTENIAFQFSQFDIPAISALEISGKHLYEISGTAFLVYPWVDAKAIDKDMVSEDHALKIAVILAKLHLINLDIPELLEPEFDVHSSIVIKALIAKAVLTQCSFANLLEQYQEKIIRINEEYHKMIPILKKTIVVSHGDLDQKNTLWDLDNHPFLIDWEAARKLNPTYEIIDASLNWSGITTDYFNQTLFIKMLKAYIQAGSLIDKNIIKAVFYGILGNWLNWMVYNIERSCKNDIENCDQQKLGIEQVHQVLPTIIRLEELIPSLIILIDNEM